MAVTVASTPCFSRLKSTRRTFCLWPPLMPRAVIRPYAFRPPVFFRVSTSAFSGRTFVMSLKSAIVMYRVDGVSGLNVLTGIIPNFPSQQLLEQRTLIPGLWRASVLGPQSCCPFAFRAKRRGDNSNYLPSVNYFLKKILSVEKKPLPHASPQGPPTYTRRRNSGFGTAIHRPASGTHLQRGNHFPHPGRIHGQ